MAGDTMQPMPMSPRQSPAELGSAAVQWACSRRGRTTVMVIVLFTVLIGLTGMRNQEAISSRYYGLSTHYQWRPYLPHLPSIIHSPFKTPSNTTLQLENGEISNVPSNLKKSTPNFHLIMASERDTDGFCQTTLSAMLLNYPPPTAVNLYTRFETEEQWETETINSTLHYLSTSRFVQDDDLVLIVDGQESWFQLPSDVIVTQYKRLLEDANLRLLDRYGLGEDGFQKFNQTIIFGAEKMCRSDDMACKYVPQSILPDDLYVKETGRRISERPAKFLNSKMVMGPARDLRVLYKAALKKLRKKRSQSQTVQSVFATLFGEQQLRRDAIESKKKPTGAKLKEFLGGSKRQSAAERRLANAKGFAPSNGTRHEFSMGLDYSHTLFQPLIYCTEDELVPITHDNSTDLSIYQRPDSRVQQLLMPAALAETKPPFWRPDLVKNNPSPNEKPAYIDKLDFNLDLDTLPKRKTSWKRVPLLQNTYTGAIPAIILTNQKAAFTSANDHAPYANITWSNLWYAPHKRALLRNYFRTPQSPNGYHNSLVGGDRAWDQRGGRGGVWTEAENMWLPWGEVDGVCGTLSQINEVFSDAKGVWLHEKEDNAEQTRLTEETELATKVEEAAKKEREKLEQMEQQKENERLNFERLVEMEEGRERDRKEQEERKESVDLTVGEGTVWDEEKRFEVESEGKSERNQPGGLGGVGVGRAGKKVE
ncbi:hypothetical protein IQ07DRAFT_678294 [Pyrenochaeta sp. DS3sAY3a]|nr:hypothetical protein IQ07DRAFT_678294 [Pyrenochaeta sp. DS3sAY3a]